MPQCQPEKSGRTRASTASSSTLVDAAVFMRAPLTLILIYIAAAVTAPKTKSRARRGEGEGGFRSRSPSPNHHPHLLSALNCVSISPVQGVSSHLTPCYVRLPTFIMAKSMVRFNMTKPIHVHARLEPTEPTVASSAIMQESTTALPARRQFALLKISLPPPPLPQGIKSKRFPSTIFAGFF